MTNATARTARMFGEADSTVDRELTDDADYELASKILAALFERAGSDFSPSQIARLAGVKASVDQVHRVLPALSADGHIRNSGRGGSWARYTFVWG